MTDTAPILFRSCEIVPRSRRAPSQLSRGPSVHMLLIQATCAALILAYTLPSPHAAALSRSPPAVTMRGGPPAHVTAKKKANKKKKVAKIKTAAPPSEDDLRAAHMALVQDSVARHAPSLLSQLDDNGYAIIDNFLPPATIQQ